MAARSLVRCALVGTLAHGATAGATAGASPRTDPTSGRAVFTGATVPNATAITLNPAALGLATTGEVFAAVTGVLDQVRVDRAHLDPATGALSPGERVRDTALGPGGMIAVVLRGGSRYTVGFELRAPPPEQFPSGHAPLRYHTLGGGHRELAASVSGTVRLTGKLFFGASVSHANTFLRLRYARDTALAGGLGPRGVGSDCDGAPCGIENPAADERYDVDVRSPYLAGSNLKVNVGLVAQIYRDVWLGLSYHSPPAGAIQTELEGTMDVVRAPRDGGAALAGRSTVYVSLPASVDAEVRARLPRLLDLHVGGRWEDLSRMTAYDVRGYGSAFAGADVPEWTLRARGMHDAFALWAGVEQVDFGQPLRFGARAGVERAAVANADTSALTIAPTSVTADVGGQLRLAPGAVLQLSYGLQLFPAVAVGASGFDPRYQLDCEAQDFDYTTPACAAVRAGFALPTAAGEYGRLQHAFRLAFRYELP